MTASEATLAPSQSLFPPSRIAISGLFLLNGLYAGAWAPKIPEFAGRLSLSESELGLMIMGFGIGSIVLMALSGAFVAHFGTARVSRVLTILFLTSMILVSIAPNVATGFVVVVLFGAFMGAMDVAINGNAVEVEKSMRRAIMSSCHGFWSFGAFLGASTGGVLMQWLGVMGHAVLLTAVGAAILAAVWSRIHVDAPHPEQERPRVRLPMTPLPWLIGLMALFSMMPEGSILDWGALYLRKEHGAPLALSGLAFGAFSLAMAIMRFLGDPIRDRFGAVRVLRVSTGFAMVGMLTAGLAPNPYIVILGFAFAGIGISNMVPIALSAAGNLPGFAQGVAMSVATALGYSGILFAPSLIGFMAEHTGFAAVFAAMPLLFVVVLFLSHHAVHADVRHRP